MTAINSPRLDFPMADTVAVTGALTTNATTVDQVVLTYTVPVGRVLRLHYAHFRCRSTALPGNSNPILFGAASVEHPAGTKLWTEDVIGNTGERDHGPSFPHTPWQIPGGGVVRVVCTPAAATSFAWKANLGGFLS